MVKVHQVKQSIIVVNCKYRFCIELFLGPYRDDPVKILISPPCINGLSSNISMGQKNKNNVFDVNKTGFRFQVLK
jgi:hypothetical protein